MFFLCEGQSVPIESGSTHGRLAERLMSEGLLTPKLLDELKKEWQFQIERERPQNLPAYTTKDYVKQSKRTRSEIFKTRKLSRK